MSLVLAWLLFPALVCALALGSGLAVERVTRSRLPDSLLVPAGMAVLIAATTAATTSETTARFALPGIVTLAAIGLALSPPWKQRSRFDAWALCAAGGVFAVFAAPVALSGTATFAGYIKLDDSAVWATLADHVVSHGRSAEGSGFSTHQAVLEYFLGRGYPVGSFVPMGLGARVVGEDALWLLQPWLSVVAAMLALSLYTLLASLVPNRPARAACAIVAAQPALLFGFAMWGGIKELATAWLVALVAAFVPWAARERGARCLIWPAIGAAAALSAGSFAGAIWIAAPLAAAVGAALRHASLGRLRAYGGIAVGAIALAVPSVALAHSFLTKFTWNGQLFTHAVTPQLPAKLSLLQLLGIWPTGDFRLPLAADDPFRVAIFTVAGAAIFGLVAAVRARAWAVVLYAVATVALAVLIASVASPWFGAKGLVIAAPAVVALAGAGIVALWQPGYRSLSVVGASALCLGVLISTARSYQAVSLAPRDQLEELQHIGRIAAGQGPTLLTEYNAYGSQHFLGPAAGEGVSERLLRRNIFMRDGRVVPIGSAVDTDLLDGETLLAYRTIVMRRSPTASRPPSPYRLLWQGHTYEVWQRPSGSHGVLARLPLGDFRSAGAQPRCTSVRRLAGEAGPDGRLAAVPRATPTIVRLGRLILPAGWLAKSSNVSIVLPSGKGTLQSTLVVSASGRFDVWLGGGIYGGLKVSIDGKSIGSVRAAPNPDGAYLSIGTVSLRAGAHLVSFALDDGGLRPGSAAQRFTPTPLLLGPLVLDPAPQRRTVTVVPAARWRELCGKQLDWIEALPGA